MLDPLIRVDQAGEVGAYYIYKGQMAVLGNDKKLKPILQEMWDQEDKHLTRFNELVGEHRVRPSLLRPLWEVAGFAVGFGTAMIGKEAAMACTEAVETAVGNHYDDLLRELVAIENPNQELKQLGEVCIRF
jgi:ubiquinone biosynthesis monooxygenase Coq7